LVGSNQGNYFENATACSKRTHAENACRNAALGECFCMRRRMCLKRKGKRGKVVDAIFSTFMIETSHPSIKNKNKTLNKFHGNG